MKQLVKGNVKVHADRESMKLVSNRYGAFTCLNPNYGGKELTFFNEQSLIDCWKKLQADFGYVYEEKAEAPKKKSLYMVEGGRKLWAKQYSEFRKKLITAEVLKLSGKELREAMEKIDAEAKALTKKWEAEYLA